MDEVKIPAEEITAQVEQKVEQKVTPSMRLRDNLLYQPQWDYLDPKVRENLNRLLEAKTVDELNAISIEDMTKTYQEFTSKQPSINQMITKLLGQLGTVPAVIADIDYV